MQDVIIDGRPIGPTHKPYIIAEISANHNGDLNKALRLIEIAKESGADAIKLQTYTADTMTIDSDSPDFKVHGGLWDGYTLYELYEEAQTPWEWHKELFAKAAEIGITIFSTPFDESAVDFLADLDVPAFKIASFELTDTPLVDYIAKQLKPIILSTGMANFEEIQTAINTIRKHHNQLIVLHCVSSYPARASESNLVTLQDISKRFEVVPGLSDHTLGTATSVASVALGACLIEKHFIESRKDKGPDSEFSLEPDELRRLVIDTQMAHESLGQIGYELKASEVQNLAFRRSIYAVKDILPGEKLTQSNVRRIRPGYGLEPKYYEKVLGKKAMTKIMKGTPIQFSLLEAN